MDCTVDYSERSLSDLHDITAFIAADNAEAAITFTNRLLDLAESLRRMPERGRLVKNWKNVRVVVLAPYLIASSRQPMMWTCCVSGTELGIRTLWNRSQLLISLLTSH
jgi:plasmid stabilization system protein ParE